jgi:hypothetical protein
MICDSDQVIISFYFVGMWELSVVCDTFNIHANLEIAVPLLVIIIPKDINYCFILDINPSVRTEPLNIKFI